MQPEEFFLVFALLLLFLDLVLLSRAKPGKKGKLEYGFYSVTFASGLIVLAYLILVQAFLSNDFSLAEVYSYSSSGLSMASKFYATWGGASSSMLFLTFLLAIVYFVYRFRSYDKGTVHSLTAWRVFDFTLIFFLIVVLMNSPFNRLSSTPIDGQGLNPLLQTFWMLVHPPIVFLGYVLIILVFVVTLADMSSGKAEENPRSNRTSTKLLLQAAWLTTTLGIAIGGVWAYEVLGWGGYWAWDAVETGSLLPWLALTAYFHLSPISKAGKSLTKEFMLLIAFVSVILTTALTRGGLLFSVHAFGASPIGPLFLLFALGMAAYFFYLKSKINKPLFALDVDKSSLYSVSFFIAFWSLIFIFLICLWGVIFPVIIGAFTGVQTSTAAGFYNNWTFPFAMAFVAALIGCSIYEKVSLKKFAALAAGGVAAGIVLLQVGSPTPNVLANLGFPLLMIALFAVVYKLARVLVRQKRSLRIFGRHLLHLAIIITLLGVFISSTSGRTSGTLAVKPNTTVQTLGLTMQFGNATVYGSTGRVYYMDARSIFPEYSALKLDVTIRQGDGVYNLALWIRYYVNYGIASAPTIISTWTGDIYLTMNITQSVYDALLQALVGNPNVAPPEEFKITVSTNSMISLVWAGVGLMSTGIALSVIVLARVAVTERSAKSQASANTNTQRSSSRGR